MKNIKDFINISNLYTEVDLGKNQKIDYIRKYDFQKVSSLWKSFYE